MPEPSAQNPMKLDSTQDVLDRLAAAEAHFAQAKEGLEQMQRLATLGTLSAMVAHEFNNILAPIIGYAQLALANPEDAELTRKALEKALSGSQRAEAIATSLLGYSRDDEDNDHVLIKDAVDAVLSYLTRSLDHDRIELIVDVAEIAVAMPRVNLEQVLLNLILNARKAMQKRGGTLKIRAKTVQNNVHIDLSDTGRGVPAQIVDHLFEPFITHDPEPEQENTKGSGLGLSICKDLVTKAGGSLSFDSTPGEGTTFHLTLPRPKPMRRSA